MSAPATRTPTTGRSRSPRPRAARTVSGPAVAVVVARAGVLPPGAAEAAAEAGGRAVVVGDGAQAAAGLLVGVTDVWWADTGPGLRPGALSAALAPALAGVGLVVLPASADGRDLAPRLAATLERPLLARAVRVTHHNPAGGRGARTAGAAGTVSTAAVARTTADVARLDDRVLVTVTVDGPAVATLLPGSRSAPTDGTATSPVRLALAATPTASPEDVGSADPEVLEVLDPDPSTMDLAEATRVLSGGAGLVTRRDGDDDARATFDLLAAVAGALGASAGATRVVTDAGWMDTARQIGTTGVALSDPGLYVAFGVSGAAQHVGGLGAPRHVVSVNTDPSCPMTAMADLGLVTDARLLLEELARRFGVTPPGHRGGEEEDHA